MSYVRLQRGNDWGTEYFTLPGKHLTPSGSACAKLGIPFRDGQTIGVRWADGSTSTEMIHRKAHSNTVHDHGNTYEAAFFLPGIVLLYRGHENWMPLDAVEVDEATLPKSVATERDDG